MSDILWRNSSTGEVVIWLMNGLEIMQTGSLGKSSTAFVIRGTGDFDGNGTSDILWQNTGTGAVSIWLMNGFQVIELGAPGTLSNGWTVAETGDFNGDGRSDILLRNTLTGAMAFWFMNGTQIAQTINLNPVSWDSARSRASMQIDRWRTELGFETRRFLPSRNSCTQTGQLSAQIVFFHLTAAAGHSRRRGHLEWQHRIRKRTRDHRQGLIDVGGRANDTAA